MVLAYLALDLSLPAMPGAFVFEADASVEGAQGGRPRPVTDIVIVPAPSGHAPVLVEPRADLPSRLPVIRHPVWLSRSGAPGLPRAVCAPPPSSEDPH